MFYCSVVLCIHVNINNIDTFKSFENIVIPCFCFLGVLLQKYLTRSYRFSTCIDCTHQTPLNKPCNYSVTSELFGIKYFCLKKKKKSVESSSLEIASLPSRRRHSASPGLCGCASSDLIDSCLTALANNPTTVNSL